MTHTFHGRSPESLIEEIKELRCLLKNLNDRVVEADARIVWEHHMNGAPFDEAIEAAMFAATAYLEALEPKP